ncbi:MAG: LON peptidase substrate-binding domain-containing protein, partial [Acidobacteriota bacterium]
MGRPDNDTSCAGSGPEIVPIFPLTGTLLLPGGLLPLHVFEPRYCHMVEDTIDAGDAGRIGMVQPVEPDPDDQRGHDAVDDDVEPDHAVPDVYPVGCAGAIEQVQRLPHDRFLVLLRGCERFRIREVSCASSTKMCSTPPSS